MSKLLFETCQQMTKGEGTTNTKKNNDIIYAFLIITTYTLRWLWIYMCPWTLSKSYRAHCGVSGHIFYVHVPFYPVHVNFCQSHF